MSAFRKAEAEVGVLLELAIILREKLESEPQAEHAEIAQEVITSMGEFRTRIQTIQPVLSKFRQNAEETDDDKKIYGPSMVSNILRVSEQFQELEKLDQVFQIRLAPITERVRLAQKQEEQAAEASKREAVLRLEAEAVAARDLEAARKKQLDQQAADEALKREQQKKAEEEEERRVYEAGVEAAALRATRLRSAIDNGISLENAISVLRSSCTSSQFSKALTVLTHIMTTVCDEPENLALRTIRIGNPNFQQDIAAHQGGEECLVALGFRIEDKNVSKGPMWVLREPDIDHFEEWPEWFELIKSNLAKLKAAKRGS